MTKHASDIAVNDAEIKVSSQENALIEIEQVSADELPMFRVLLQNEYQG
ncbi:hypothetical protein [Chitinimonas sp. BJB300]|nr:hypothetical protein [Chitinimonas sp. BJB300]